jgi:cobalamin biosynthesis Mg chelatase CobN
MSATMQEAIAAARAGDKQQAQLLLSQYIQANPNDAQGWYLMSQLVDSKARRAAYLSKTLAINPWHERAWAEYYSLPTEVINALESAQSGQPVQPAPRSQAPDWVAPAVATAAVPATVTESPSRVQRVTSSEAVAAATVAAEVAPEPVPAAAEPVAAASAIDAPARETPAASGNSGLTTLLIVLIVATLLVLAFLVYLLLQG